MRSLYTSLLFCLLLASSASGQAPKQSSIHKTKHKAPEKAVQIDKPTDVVPPPQPAQPPPTPEQGPSSPPDVNFQGGQLVIVARNSTMGDVLNAVKQKTGASVEMPASSSERVVGKFGPGAPRDVMAQLLNGSQYDYVLLGSPADPGALKKIILMARANGPEQASPQQPGPRQPVNQGLQTVPDVEPESPPEENATEAPVENQQPEEEQQPDQQQVEQPEQPEQPQQGQPGQPMVKTPEQLLRELQQQQQQQQQEQQQNPPP